MVTSALLPIIFSKDSNMYHWSLIIFRFIPPHSQLSFYPSDESGEESPHHPNCQCEECERRFQAGGSNSSGESIVTTTTTIDDDEYEWSASESDEAVFLFPLRTHEEQQVGLVHNQQEPVESDQLNETHVCERN